MEEKVLQKIQELEEDKNTYLEILGSKGLFTEDYLLKRIHDIKVQIYLLKDLLDEYHEEV